MSESLKKIVIIGICIAAAGFGYYMLTSDDGVTDLNDDSALRDELINKTQSFIDHRNRLEQINFDQSFFTDSTFTSLRSFSTPVPEQSLGRDDLFGSAGSISKQSQLESGE